MNQRLQQTMGTGARCINYLDKTPLVKFISWQNPMNPSWQTFYPGYSPELAPVALINVFKFSRASDEQTPDREYRLLSGHVV
jgi:hypothetical protein